MIFWIGLAVIDGCIEVYSGGSFDGALGGFLLGIALGAWILHTLDKP